MTTYLQFSTEISAPDIFDPGNGLSNVAKGFSSEYSDADAATVEAAAVASGIVLLATPAPLYPAWPGLTEDKADTLAYLYNLVVALIGGGPTVDPNAVHFTAQTLTTPQQAQARTNIGAAATGGGGGGGAGSDTTALHYTADSGLTSTEILQALTNMGLGGVFPIAAYDRSAGAGSTHDDLPAIQAAVNAANTAGGGFVIGDPTKTYHISNSVIWKTGVHGIFGPSGPPTGTGGRAVLSPMSSFPTDTFLVDTASASVKIQNYSIVGLAISVPVPTSTASTRYGGVRIQKGNYGWLAGLSIGGCSYACLLIVNGLKNYIENSTFQSFFNYRTLTQNEGAFTLGGTDHTVRNLQCNGGDNTAVQYPTTYYRCGALIGCLTSWIFDINGEYSDTGIKITGASNTFHGARGDVNAGRGITLEGVGCILNQLIGTKLYANSNEYLTTGASGVGNHDGVYIDTSSLGNVINGLTALTLTADPLVGPLAGQQVTATSRYIVNDNSNPGTNPRYTADGLNLISNLVAPYSTYRIDKVNQIGANTFFPIYKSHATFPIFRLPSRYCTGESSVNTQDHHSAYSDSIYWRAKSGDTIVGNRHSADGFWPRTTAKFATYTLGGGAANTVSIVNGEGGSYNKNTSIFNVPQVYQIKATAVGTHLDVLSEILPVEAGNVYTLILLARGAGKAYTVTPSINFFDAAHSTGTGAGLGASSLTGVSVANSATTPTTCTWTGITAPSTAVSMLISYAFAATVAVNDVVEFGLDTLAVTTDNTVSPAKTYTVAGPLNP